MSVRLAAVALVLVSCSTFLACGGGEAQSSPPLIPEATSSSVNQPSTRPVPATRTLESKTIGADGHSATSPTSTNTRAPSAPSPAAQPTGAWSPTPVNGVMNPSPPAGTPVYGEMNPSPPGR